MADHFDIYTAFIEVSGVFDTFEDAMQAVAHAGHTDGLTPVRMNLLHSTGEQGATTEILTKTDHEVDESTVQPYLVTVAHKVSGEVFLTKYVITFAEVIDAGRDPEDGSLQGGDDGSGDPAVEHPGGVEPEEPGAPSDSVSTPGVEEGLTE